MTEQKRSGGIGEGIRTGLGILTAFKDAAEETLQEMVDRGDLTPERAKSTMRDAVGRMQSTFDDARGKIDLVSQADLTQLREEIAELRARVTLLENNAPGGGRSPGDSTPPGGIIVSE